MTGYAWHRVVTLWRESLSTKNPKAAQSLANPAEYENLFPGLQDALKAEQFLTAQRQRVLPASSYPAITVLYNGRCYLVSLTDPSFPNLHKDMLSAYLDRVFSGHVPSLSSWIWFRSSEGLLFRKSKS